MPEVSVLLCVHNPGREELSQAVQSIVEQTFREWEMILYDDGSDEKQAAFVREISFRDRRIRYVRSEVHHSLAYGLNESLRLAAGEYIARMDGDDISQPERFAKQLAFLKGHPQYMWVGSNIIMIDEKGESWGERTYPMIPENRDFLQYSPYVHPSVMFRKKIFFTYGGYIEGRKACRGEDYELLMRFHALGKRGFNLQEPLLWYRETRQSYKKRKLRFQIQEAGIRFYGFRRLGILTPKTAVYVVKPVFTWLIPGGLKFVLKRKQGQPGRVSVESVQ